MIYRWQVAVLLEKYATNSNLGHYLEIGILIALKD
jgi:hypothetical protein